MWKFKNGHFSVLIGDVLEQQFRRYILHILLYILIFLLD